MSPSDPTLQNLKVFDVMRRDVASVSANATLEDAARLLLDSDADGAAVVDEYGQCVGVISRSDLLRRDQAHAADAAWSSSASDYELAHDDPSRPFYVKNIAEDRVRRYMTGAARTIDANASLLAAGQTLSAAHIHQLFVLDDQAIPVGVVSALDIVKALAGPNADH